MRFGLAGAPLSRRCACGAASSLFTLRAPDALQQPRPRPDLARGDGTGRHLGSRSLAQSTGHGPPLRCAHHPPGSSGSGSSIGAGPCACRPGRQRRSCSASPSRRSSPPTSSGTRVDRRHARHQRPSYARVLLWFWVVQSDGRAVRQSMLAPHRVDPRLHRSALLAAVSPVVSPGFPWC